MSKYVREKSAAKSIAAYVILKGKKHVATIQVYHGNGSCLVNIWHTDGKTEMQHGRASGYGYDRFTAALTGLTVCGHKLNDHCGARLKLPKGAEVFPRDFKAPRGYHMANWSTERNGYTDCYRHPGMRFLEEHFTVIQAI